MAAHHFKRSSIKICYAKNSRKKCLLNSLIKKSFDTLYILYKIFVCIFTQERIILKSQTKPKKKQTEKFLSQSPEASKLFLYLMFVI